jgi:REP element-mobilizing transposase RayT
MARKPRLHYPGAFYHVILRGNFRQDTFLVERYRYRIHAFCLMSNHVHLAIQVGVVPLSRIMQNFCFRYTRWLNQQQERVGHLFQGRYKAVLLDADSYLLELTRYIHLNPAGGTRRGRSKAQANG